MRSCGRHGCAFQLTKTLAHPCPLWYDRDVTFNASPARAAIYAFTPQGAQLGSRIADTLRGDLFLPRRLAETLPPMHFDTAEPFDSLSKTVARLFHQRSMHIFISAAGVAVRAIAPHLHSKDIDPAVVVMDQEGRFCISLLSGHLGGANALARELATLTGGQAVITTATDVAGLPALDELGSRLGLHIANLDAAKSVSAALLQGATPQLFDPLGIFSSTDLDESLFLRVHSTHHWQTGLPGAWVHWSVAPDTAFGLHPPCLFAGIGCRRGTDVAEILTLIRSTFAEHHLAPAALVGLASIDAKADEPGLLQAAARLGVPLSFFTPHQLDGMTTPTPSEMVRKHMGVSSVCEAAAMLASRNSTLIVPKTSTKRATIAVAASSWPVSAPEIPTT